jgi:GTPase KRas protein
MVDDQQCMIEIFAMGGELGLYADLCSTWEMDAHAAILLYSITSRLSFSRIRTLHGRILRITPRPIALVGNNIEKEDEREVSTTEARALAKELGCALFEVSAKDRINVEEPIIGLVRELRERPAA